MTRRTAIACAAAAALQGVVKAASAPRPAPEFAIMLPQGGHMLLSQHRGKVIVLEFLATTCSHCQSSAQMLTRLQNQYGPQGFQALGVGFNDGAKGLVADFVKTFRVGFPVGWSERSPVLNFLGLPLDSMVSVPQIAIIDRKGIIQRQSLPNKDNVTGTEGIIRLTVEKLLAEAPAPSSRKSAKPKKRV